MNATSTGLNELYTPTSSNYSDPIDYGIVNGTTVPASTSSRLSRFYPLIVTEMILSILCLLITIFVYSVLPEFKNVHGKNLITLCSCLITAFVFLIMDLLLRSYLAPTACYVFAVVIHFSFLATFFWTNVMAFDICRSMTVLRPNYDSKHSKKYIYYSIYAWTATAVTSLPAFVFDKTDWLDKAYRPNFGASRCWLSGTRAFVMYFNAPVGILLLSNLFMFGITVYSLIRVKKLTDKMDIIQQRQQFHLYLKLLLVVGAIWLTEFLPWVTGIHKLYALAGILTSFHGVLLLIIFVCKKRILRQLMERYRTFSRSRNTRLAHSTMGCSATVNSADENTSKV